MAVAKKIRSRGRRSGLAPVIDVVRDPRWGRTGRTMGEDPYLNARLGCGHREGFFRATAAMESRSTKNIWPPLKHLGVHGESEGGVNVAPSFVDETGTRVFFKPFRPASVSRILPTS